MPEIYPNPFQGLKLSKTHQARWHGGPEIYPNPFQGLKPSAFILWVAAAEHKPRNLPESLSGIETLGEAAANLAMSPRNLPESLSGIETVRFRRNP